MKKTVLSLLTLVALLFTACDKIEEDQYIIYSGASGEWVDGNGVSDHSQRALIEKYTGVRCLNCPTAEDAINAAVAQYGGKLLAVAIHDSSTFTRPYPNNPDLRTATGNTWSKFFGVFDAGQYPVALVNRTPGASGWDLFNPISGINSYVDPIVNSEATIAIEVSATEAEGLISTTVNLEFLENVGDNLNLTLFIIEDNINATQLMPNGEKNESYIHNHLFREVITDVWGTQIDCTGAKGEKKMTTIDYQVDNSEWIIANCHIVAFVSNRDTRQIVNVAECDIN